MQRPADFYIDATAEEKLHARKQNKAWSEETRRREALYLEAVAHRYAAMYRCRRMGIPLDTIAADAGTDRSAVHRNIAKHAQRNNLPLPKGPAYIRKQEEAA